MKKVILIIFLSLNTIQVISQQKNAIEDIAIFLQNNVEILDFAGPMEVFLIAGFNVYTVAETNAPITAMHSLKVIPDYSIANAPTPDIVVFVGGGDLALAEKDTIKHWVKKVSQATELQMTVCTGAFFLAEVGLLDHRIATTYHRSIDHLKNRFPDIDVRDNVRFVDNGEIITTAGISAGIDGALHLVSKLKGEKHALNVARLMEYYKWIPEEGLIIRGNHLEAIEKQGFENFLQDTTVSNLYPGEILNLSQQLHKKGQYKEAGKGIKYVIKQSDKPGIELYEYLRENYQLQGKAVPMTSAAFMDVIKKEGLTEAKKVYEENIRTFDGWVFVDPDDIISLAYVDYYLKGHLKEAKAIQSFAKVIFPHDAYVTYVLGVYHEKGNEIDRAVNLYKEALRIDPQFVMAKDKLRDLKQEGKI